MKIQKEFIGFENVRRTALVLKKKKPFFDWLKRIEPSENYDFQENDHDVYLLPDFEEINQMENWLKINFDQLFSDQLNNWYIDPSIWVQNRTFKMFIEWFDYSLHTMIWDTVDKPIEKL